MPLSEPMALSKRRAFGQTVRRLRLAHGWTQEELAHRTGFDRKSINRVENATYSPSIDRVFALAEALGAAAADLLADADAVRSPRRGRRD